MAESTLTQKYNATTQTATAYAIVVDTISGKDYPVSKVAFGAEGTVVYADASNPLPVVSAATDALLTTIDADTGAIATSAASIDGKITACNTGAVVVSSSVLPTGASTLAEQQTQTSAINTLIGHVDGVESALTDAVTALQVIDDWDDTNRCKVNLIVGEAGITAGAGAVAASTPRVTLASDDPAVASLGTLEDATGYVTPAYAVGPAVAVQLGFVNDEEVYVPVSMQTGGGFPIQAGSPLVVTNAGSGGGESSLYTQGPDAHGGAPGGHAFRIAARAETALSGITLASDGNVTNLYAGVDGVLIIRPHTGLEDIVSGVVAITDGSSTSCIAAQGSGIKTYITSCTIANSSATPVTVDLRDGTAGSVKWTFPVPAGAGVTHTFPTPLAFSDNTIVAADPSAAATTVTISLAGFKSKV